MSDEFVIPIRDPDSSRRVVIKTIEKREGRSFLRTVVIEDGEIVSTEDIPTEGLQA